MHEGRILKRYKRFLADVQLPHGEEILVHVPNTGSMKNCWAPGWTVWMSHSSSPTRKIPWTLEITSPGDSFIMVNTTKTNSIAGEALRQNKLSAFAGYQQILPEQKIGQSRIDFLLKGHPTLPDCWIEVKNVTLVENDDLALFPDSVSERGRKHLEELIELRLQGFRAAMLFVISHSAARRFAPAALIDPAYAKALKEAAMAGVEIHCYRVEFEREHLTLGGQIPVEGLI